MIKLQISVVDEGKVLGTTEVDLTPQAPPQVPEDRMSDAQRRYLFRLLADMGIEGDRARETIKEQIAAKEQRPVRDVKEVTKSQASWLIEKFKADIAKWRQAGAEGGSHGQSQ